MFFFTRNTFTDHGINNNVQEFGTLFFYACNMQKKNPIKLSILGNQEIS